MNTGKLDKLISEYVNNIYYSCSSCVAFEYCSKIKEEEKDLWKEEELWLDCHGMIEGWLNS